MKRLLFVLLTIVFVTRLPSEFRQSDLKPNLDDNTLTQLYLQWR